MGGQFKPANTGQFKPAMGGLVKPAMGGQFHRRLQYYGDEKIRSALTAAKWLPLETIYLASAVLGNEITDYKCYTQAQSNPQHWIY